MISFDFVGLISFFSFNVQSCKCNCRACAVGVCLCEKTLGDVGEDRRGILSSR